MTTTIENTNTRFTGVTLLDSDEIASMLNISKSFVYKLIQQGELPVVRMGRAVRVRLEDLNAYIEKSIYFPNNGNSFI